MEQQPAVPVQIYTTPVMFMDREANFDKGLINKPFDYKGRVCYATGFYVVSPAGVKYLQVHTNHTGKPVENFISEANLRDKSKNSIPFDKAA